MRRKVIAGAVILLLVVASCAAYVGLRVRSELVAARAVLDGSPEDLTAASLEGADSHLVAALARLQSPPARLLRVLPVTRQNVLALEHVAGAIRPVLRSGASLERAVRNVEAAGLMAAGKIDVSLLKDIEPQLGEQVRALRDLEGSAQRNRSGWLAPMLWDEIESLLGQAGSLRAGAEKAHGLVSAAPAMLGINGSRTYLIVLLNNAELRGAGGIPSGVGTVTIRNGALRLGRFDYAPNLRGPHPYIEVEAPADFERRYGRYWADRTFWVNTTMSSDVPDVAEVARRLYAEIPGRKTDGVLFADPHGVAALMKPDATIDIPGTDTSLTADDLSDYAYSTVYELERSGAVEDRHDALLEIGELAFREILAGGIDSRDQLGTIAAAFAAGHLRFVSFHPDEQRALHAAGATGDIRPPEADSLFVTAYNTGADKMDYWARRAVSHRCIVSSDESAECSTSVTLRNVVPKGLPRIVAGRPYGVLTNFLEIYVPEQATIEFVEQDDRGAEYFEDRQDGHRTIGFNVRLQPGNETTVEVGYSLSLDGAYRLDVMPQPLSHPAPLDIEIQVPEGWAIRGPSGAAEERLDLSTMLTQSMTIEAVPQSRSGISALWYGLVRFWNEPLG